MTHPSPRRLLAAVLLLLAGAGTAGAAIERVSVLTRSPERFARVDIVAVLTAAWVDPFDAEDVRVDLELTAPSGKAVVVPAFLERGASGRPSVWAVRFAPAEAGLYTGRLAVASRAGREESAAVSFSVAPSARRGFLHPAGPWIFSFDNGEPFRGLGENLCWEARANDDSRYFKALHEDPRFNYATMLASLSSAGSNFTRIWMCSWNLPLEWKRVSPDTDRYSDDPGHFNASAIRRMDEVVGMLDAAGVYAMLTLDAHGGLLGGDWARNNYNAANGGPCATPAEFFTNPRAKAMYRQRLRYIVARWGYSPHIAVWELFNEVDNAMYRQQPQRIPDADVAAWHGEMSAYLKRIDPYGHMVTTSISHRDVAGMFEVPGIDFGQRHIYRDTASIPGSIRRFVRAWGKPCVVGEFGYEWDWSLNFNEFAGMMDRDFKQGPWLGLFSPTPVLPMSWWWEFFDERGLTPYLRSVREVSDRMLAAGGGQFEETQVGASGLTTLAVRCGRQTFAYALNPSGAAWRGELSVTAPGVTVVEAFDPESRAWAPGQPVRPQGGKVTMTGFALGPGQCRILVFK